MHKGYFHACTKLAFGLHYIILDELNQAIINEKQLAIEFTNVDVDAIFEDDSEYEALIDYERTNG
jgi:hypothetical protein